METRKASRTSWKHIVFCIVLLLIFVLTIGTQIDAEGYSEDAIADSETSDTVPLQSSVVAIVDELSISEDDLVELAGPKEEVTVDYSKVDQFITSYVNELQFFAKTFGVSYDDIILDLIKRNENDEEFEKTNPGKLLNSKGKVKTFKSAEYGIVEYFYDYVEKHPRKVNNKREAYSGESRYVENLIIYYTTHVYTNVDTTVALSIGAAESGYYKSKYMLACNNVFGGMTKSGLKKYKNIEYGVLSYIRMLSNQYYGKGLTTVNSIGRKYCPKYDNNGNKIASPHWISLVNTAIKKYQKSNSEIQIEEL